jgi:hypothetical protein
MNNKKMVPVLAVLALFAVASVDAADKTCTRPDIANAQRAIDKIVTWSQLRKAYTDFKHCDTGDTADQFTDALLRLTVDWKGVEEFATAAQKDPDYMEFFVRHVQSPAAKDDRETVYARAKKECPKTYDEFCAKVADATKVGGGTSAASDPGGIGIQPLMQPLKIETTKPAAKPDAPKSDAK